MASRKLGQDERAHRGSEAHDRGQPAQPDDIHVEHITVEQRLKRIKRAKRKESQKARDKDEAQVVVAKRKSRTLGHAAQNTALRLFPFCGNNALVTAQGEHGRHAHHARHEQIDRLRGKTAHDGTAEQRASGIGDIAVEHHETVHAGTALGGRLQVSRKRMRAGVDKAARKPQDARGKHKPGDRQRRQPHAKR